MGTEISGSLVLNRYSVDSGSTWKTIVCETDSEITGNSTVTETKTKTCGTKTAVENDAMTVTGNGVAGGDLEANQASYQDIQILRYAKTKILFERKNLVSGTVAEGEISYALFEGYFNQCAEQSPTDDVTKFSWGVTSTGTITLTPES